MKLSIHTGIWNIQSLDGTVHVLVYPRRALEGAATKVVLRAEPMPALVLEPEGLHGSGPVEGWVWDGSPAAARAIVPQILAAIRQRLSATTAATPRARQWRARVVASLFPGASGQMALSGEQQAG
jgi:hypothetical protein